MRNRSGREAKAREAPRERDFDRRPYEPSSDWRAENSPAERRYIRPDDVNRPDARPLPGRDNHFPPQRNNRDRRPYERTDSRADSRADTRVDSRADTRVDSRADSRVDSRGDSRVDSRAESRVESLTDSRIDSRIDSSRKRSRERDSLKRPNTNPDSITQPDNKQSKSSLPTDMKNFYMINDLLESPGREVRPQKIAIILRGMLNITCIFEVII